MVPAAVGFQCPECVAAGQSNQRLVTSTFGQADPVVTYALIAMNAAMFLLTAMSPAVSDQLDLFAGINRLVPPVLVSGIADGEWWRVLTSGFLHAGILHIGFNMYALYILGPAMERTVGWPRFITIYFVSLIGGSAGALLSTDPRVATVGASGAIFGMFGAFIFLQLSRGQNPMQGGIGPIILLNLFITLVIPGISKGGHVGGLIAGIICGYVLLGRNRTEALQRARHTKVLVPACLALGVVLFGVAVWAAYYATDNLGALI